jgi:signal transduction histidine kinase
MWLKTALLGTLMLAALFAGYEVAERLWMRGRLPAEQLFAFHLYRGIGASVLVGTLSVLSIWRSRRAYDEAFVAAYREVEATVEKRTRELSQAHAFTEKLFDALRDRLTVVDRDGVVVKANRVALEGGGETPVGQRCPGLGGACNAASQICVAMRAHRDGVPIVGQCVRTDPRSGRIYTIDAYPVPDLGGSGPLVIESVRDITEAKQLEAMVRYQEKLAALGVLAAGIAHDIANPLASMSSELEMIEGEQDLARVRESIGVLRRQVSRIDRTLREMTDFARRRGDEVTLVSVPVAVDDALRMVRHDPRARRVSITVEIPKELPPVRMVEDHLVMVLVNLFINALDAMPEGGTLAVRARRHAGGVSLAVADTGRGMTPEVRRRAPEPLFTTKEGGRGTGLGLSVSADLLRAAGGSLDIESAPDRGTTVTLELPSSESEARTRLVADA